MHRTELWLAGHRLTYETREDRSAVFLEAYRRLCEETQENAFRPAEEAVESVLSVSDERFLRVRRRYPAEATPAEIELGELLFDTSAALLSFGSCLFHGVAFRWRGKAWIFTGPSGVGKSTQYMLWKLRYGDELSIINGDKPLLSHCPDGSFLVSGSPWNGKEHMGRDVEAPLGGIILLEQAKENRLKRLSPPEAAPRLFLQFLLRPRDEAELNQLIALEEALLDTVPVMLLKNCGDSASAELLHEALTEENE